MADRIRIRNISDLARLAGVSAGTVSRALSDTGLISQKTRERIKALAREHDFRPNIMARNLRIQKTGAIGVILPAPDEQASRGSHALPTNALAFLANALAQQGYDLLLLARAIPEAVDWLDQIVDSGRVDGVIMIGKHEPAGALEKVASRYRPLVVWGGDEAQQSDCAVAWGDDIADGARKVVELLLPRI